MQVCHGGPEIFHTAQVSPTALNGCTYCSSDSSRAQPDSAASSMPGQAREGRKGSDLRLAALRGVAAEAALVDQGHVQADQPGADADVLIRVAVQDGHVAAEVLGDGARHPVDLAAGVAHVVDAPVVGGRVPKAPVLWLVPLVAAVRQHLPRLHAALRGPQRSHKAEGSQLLVTLQARDTECQACNAMPRSMTQLGLR